MARPAGMACTRDRLPLTEVRWQLNQAKVTSATRANVAAATLVTTILCLTVTWPAAAKNVGPKLVAVEVVKGPGYWNGTATFEMVEYPDQWMEKLKGARGWAYRSHICNTLRHGIWTLSTVDAPVDFRPEDDVATKLQAMNRAVGEWGNPVEGAVYKMRFGDNNTDNNAGAVRGQEALCPSLLGAPWFGDLSDLKHTPTLETYPPGQQCFSIPTNDSDDCFFDTPNAAIDLGAVQAGGSKTGKVSLSYVCSAGGTFRIGVLGPDKGKITGEAGVAYLRTSSGPLPAKLEGGAGVKHTVDLYADFVGTAGWTGALLMSGVLTVEME
ncbi:TPA: hypothetical protein RUW97_004115 [Aeromonas dhakensis]|nr:hypothetical protein [Aeromonas dhakensis]